MDNNVYWEDIDPKSRDKWFAYVEHIEDLFDDICVNRLSKMQRLLKSSGDSDNLLIYYQPKNGDIASLKIEYYLPPINSNEMPYASVCVKTNLPLKAFSAVSPVKLNNMLHKAYELCRIKLKEMEGT